MKLIQIAESFIEKIRTDYKEEVSLVVVMGSYVFDEIHDRSDLDIFFVPKTDRGYKLGFTFIIDEIGFDLWPISWERLEGIAHHQERITSILTDGKILYFATPEDLMRFQELKNSASEMEDEKVRLKRSLEVFSDSHQMISRLHRETDLSGIRRLSILILNNIAHTLSLLNGKPIRRGRSRLKKEILEMKLNPKDFSRLYDTVFFSDRADDLKARLTELHRNTEMLISDEKARLYQTGSVKEVFDGFFEELINCYNKIEHACEISDPLTCLFAACEIHEEIDHALEWCKMAAPELPDILEAYDPENLDGILMRSREHKALFTEFLESNGVTIRRFRNQDEFEEYLQAL